MKNIPILILLALIISSCSYKEITFEALEGVKIKKFTQEEINLEVKARINNPNLFKIKIMDIDIDMLVKNKEIGTLVDDHTLKIKAKSSDTHTFIIKTSMDKIIGEGMLNISSLISGKPIPVEVNGSLTAKGLMVKKLVEINFEDNISLLDLR